MRSAAVRQVLEQSHPNAAQPAREAVISRLRPPILWRTALQRPPLDDVDHVSDHAPVFHAILTTYIRRQKRLYPQPLDRIALAPNQLRINSEMNQQPIHSAMTFFGFGLEVRSRPVASLRSLQIVKYKLGGLKVYIASYWDIAFRRVQYWPVSLSWELRDLFGLRAFSVSGFRSHASREHLKICCEAGGPCCRRWAANILNSASFSSAL